MFKIVSKFNPTQKKYHDQKEKFRSLKQFLRKFTPIWKFLVWSKKWSKKLGPKNDWSDNGFLSLLRLIDLQIMKILFHVWPEQTYKFSTRKLLPSKKNRYSKESRPVIPYDLLRAKSSNISKMKEISVIGRGSSFDKSNIKDMNGPIFLVPSWCPMRIDKNGKVFHPNDYSHKTGKYTGHKVSDLGAPSEELFSDHTDKEFRQDNITYISNRKKFIERFQQNGNKVLGINVHATNEDGNHYSLNTEFETSAFDHDQCKIISLAEKVYKPPLLAPYPYWAATYSFLPALCALSFFAEKINVYGWDFYLDSSPEDMNYWELFFNMCKYKNYDTRAGNIFEAAIVNFYFGYQLSKLSNFNIHGYMGQLGKHEKLIKRIERVLFK